MVKLIIEMSGGLDLLFNKVKRHEITIPDGWKPSSNNTAASTAPTNEHECTMKLLLQYMKETMLAERPELFLAGETIRPGIMVLINDADWELEGKLDYVLQDNDNIAFISTLHGG